MYVIAANESIETKHFGGSEVAKRVENCKHAIYKLDYKMSDVISFSCGRCSTTFIIAGEKNTTPSIIPGKPNEEGLVHFYKKDNEWKFIS